jgi:hypothetical protein
LLADLPPKDQEPPAIALEIVAKDSYVSGEQGTVLVAFVNQSGKEVDMIFEHRCLYDRAAHLFDLEVIDGRGASAMLDIYRAPIGLIGSGLDDCQFPYIRAKVPADGRVSIEIPFDVSVLEWAAPELPPGALAPGVYSVEVTTALARRPFLKGRFRLNVKRP